MQRHLVRIDFGSLKKNGQKLGTLQKEDTNGWIFLSHNRRKKVFHTQDSLYEKFGQGIFANDIQVPETPAEPTEWEVHGYPVNQPPYNPVFDVQKQLPMYTKTPKSKSQFCAGYYIICFEKGWRKAYCPKVITLQRYPYQGPIKSKIEMQQILNNAIKEQTTNTTN
jgi:hypothetical protein